MKNSVKTFTKKEKKEKAEKNINSLSKCLRLFSNSFSHFHTLYFSHFLASLFWYSNEMHFLFKASF